MDKLFSFYINFPLKILFLSEIHHIMHVKCCKYCVMLCSYLDRSVWGSWMFSMVVFLGFHWDSTGLAAARTEVRALSWQMIPAYDTQKLMTCPDNQSSQWSFTHPPHLSNRERLLLHDLMQHRPRAVAHLIELVNAADAVVAEHERSCLQNQLSGFRVLHHVSCETHSAGSFPRRVLTARNQVIHVLEQLGFTGTRIAAKQDVDLCAEVSTPRLSEVLTGPTK